MVTARGVRTHFRMEVKLPLLDAPSRARVIRNVQAAATSDARKRIVTPTRRTIPRGTNALRRSFKIRRPRRTRSSAYFTLLVFRFRYYYYFQDPSWEQFRQRVFEQSDEVLSAALLSALRLEGLR